MAETTNPPAADQKPACVDCGTGDGQLHHGETVTTRVADGVLRDTTVVRCTPCLKARKTRPVAGTAAR